MIDALIAGRFRGAPQFKTAANGSPFVSFRMSATDRRGYVLAYGWREQLCAAGSRKRQLRTYALLSRPKKKQADLFENT